MPNRFSCGAERARIDRPTLVISRAATIGSASCSPVENTLPPHSAICSNGLPDSGKSLIGMVRKLSASTESIDRCTFKARNSRIVTNDST